MPQYDLSKESVRASLPRRGARYWNRVGLGRHVGVYVGLSGDVLWRARYRTLSGQYRERTLGYADPPGALSFQQAVEEAERWFESDAVRPNAVSRHELHYNGQLIFCPCGPEFTVGHALRDFVEWKRLAAARSFFCSTLTLINYHLVPRVASIPLSEFTGRHFHQLCVDVLETPPKRGNQRRQSGRRPISEMDPEALRRRKKTMNAITSVLRGAFNLAWENGEIETDRPMRCLKRLPNYDRPRAIFLSRAECSALIETSRPDLRQLILAALYTGCRVHELTTLRVRHVAREGYGIYVSPSKNYRPRFVFLPDEGMAFFLAACEGKLEDDLVFVNADGRQWSDRYKHLFRRVVDEVRLPQETVFHCLRHTYASQLVGAGVPLPVVAKQLGHESTSTVDKIYGHLAPQQAEEEVNRRFTPLSSDFAARAAATRERLHELRSKFRVTDARFYSAISGYSSWPRSNHSHFSGSILFQLRSGSQR